ncbi:MAG: UDP-N-acetylmuramoyl-L-alanine--D-glutamate ligase [Pseudomonadota bacterium]
MEDLKNKKVLIIGLARSGLAAARFAAERGAKVIVSDSKPEKQLKEQVQFLKDLNLEFSLGKNDQSLMTKADLIVASPGVPLNLAGLDQARAKGIPIVSEMELALNEINKPIIAITGTNGKTTTTSLIGHVLHQSGLKVCVAGNIGQALSGMVKEANAADWVVLEVSSFQLETTPSLAPQIAILLNVTADHLDRHGNLEKYLQAKLKIFANLKPNGFGVYNAEIACQPSVACHSRESGDPTLDLCLRRDDKHRNYIAFNAKNDFQQGNLITRIKEYGEKSWSLAEVNLFGAHNYENLLAAIIASQLVGLEDQTIAQGLKTFKGLPHRLELVGEQNGVRYFNDSKGTNVGATIAALENFQNVILIAGGQGKGGDFLDLAAVISQRVKKMILIGETKQQIAEQLGKLTDTVFADNLEQAVKLAHHSAGNSDVVLLSPACASFDMFKDYVERGDVFKKEVSKYLTKDCH